MLAGPDGLLVGTPQAMRGFLVRLPTFHSSDSDEKKDSDGISAAAAAADNDGGECRSGKDVLLARFEGASGVTRVCDPGGNFTNKAVCITSKDLKTYHLTKHCRIPAQKKHLPMLNCVETVTK